MCMYSRDYRQKTKQNKTNCKAAYVSNEDFFFCTNILEKIMQIRLSSETRPFRVEDF